MPRSNTVEDAPVPAHVAPQNIHVDMNEVAN